MKRTFYINMAGLTIEIQARHRYVYNLCKDFRTKVNQADLAVSATDEEIKAQFLENQGSQTAGYCESLCLYRKISLQLPQFDGFLIHGAAVAVAGEAYLFLAKSGVGKSTHVQLWQELFGNRARVVNGDKPILRRLDGRWYICGTPWRGKEELGNNDIVPLKALCFLERGEENCIEPVSSKWTIDRIFYQLLIPQEEKLLTAFFELLDDVLRSIPCYRLQCNKQIEAAKVSWTGMQQTE